MTEAITCQVIVIGDKERDLGAYETELGFANSVTVRTSNKTAPSIKAELQTALQSPADLILTAGGTGLAADNCTPEVIQSLGGQVIAGLGELLRREGFGNTPLALLSRGEAYRLEDKLIVALSGSPRAFAEQVRIISPLIPPAIKALKGRCEKRAP